MSNVLDAILENYPEEEFLKADGLDDAIIGVDVNDFRLIYSISKAINILIITMGISYPEASEYLHYNSINAFMGEKTPIWCDDEII